MICWDSERIGFETVCEEKIGLDISKDDDGDYEDSDTQHAWSAWQARAVYADEKTGMEGIAGRDVLIKALDDMMYHCASQWSNSDPDIMVDLGRGDIERIADEYATNHAYVVVNSDSQLLEAIEYAERMLTNMQPHIAQACDHQRVAFIDNYVDPVLYRLRTILYAKK